MNEIVVPEIVQTMLSHPPTWAVTFMIIDVITGLYQAIRNKTVSSHELKDGWFRKGAELMFLILIIILNFALQSVGIVPAGYEELISIMSIPTVSGYLIIKELTSVCENICKANPELANAPFMQYFAVASETKNKTE